MTASKLGKAAGVSESTVVRFAYELDYDGYPQLQKAMNVIVKTQSSSLQRLENTRSSVGNENPLKSILKTDTDRIRETIAEIDEYEFSRAVESIVSARKVYIIGARSSGFLAEFLGYYLRMILDDVHIVDFNGEVGVFEQIHRIQPEDVFIGISFRGIRESRHKFSILQAVREQQRSRLPIACSLR